MVPLHAAFMSHDPRRVGEFAEHFKALTAHREDLASDTLSRLQYLYVASQFVVLAEQHGRRDVVPSSLPGLLAGEVVRLWTHAPAWQWDRAPFADGMRERLRWKLARPAYGKSYYRAVLDEELFLLAIAADLSVVREQYSEVRAADGALREMRNVVARIFDTRVDWHPDGGWLFQPGVWRDHPDFRFAGVNIKKQGLKVAPVANVAEDSSHTRRMALWLGSFYQADLTLSPSGSGRFRRLLDGLRRQFLKHVLVAPTPDFPGYRLTNYMDGSNGLYRWGYPSLGPNRGYGPYESSASFLLGWWVFLGGKELHDVYARQAACFPLSSAVIALYAGPPSRLYADDAVVPTGWLTNGLGELIVNLAADVAGPSAARSANGQANRKETDVTSAAPLPN